MSWMPEDSASVEDQWQHIRRQLIELTDQVAPLRRVSRQGNPPWWRSCLTKALKRKAEAWRRYKFR